MKAKSRLVDLLFGKLKQHDQNYWFCGRRLRGGSFCIERYPKPSYTRTTAQDTQRNKFKDAINAWKALSPGEKEEWNRNAEPFGLTGYQYFIQQYLLAPPPPPGIWYKVTIDNTGGSSLTGYQILINIVGDSQFFSDCENKREAIRLFDTDKETSISYWIEEWDTSNHNARIWVKVPSIPANASKDIYISVDPDRTTDASSGDDTFLFFDDFNDLSKWADHSGGYITASDSILTITNDAHDTGWHYLYHDLGAAYKIRFLARARCTDDGNFASHQFLLSNATLSAWDDSPPNSTGADFYDDSKYAKIRVVDTSDTQTFAEYTPYSLNTWYRFFGKYPDSIYIYSDDYGTTHASQTGVTGTFNDVRYIYVQTRPKYDQTAQTSEWDFLAVMKYATPDPTVTYTKETT